MSILKASAGLTLLAIAVRFLGLLRDLVLVWLFGATAETDAFYAVSNIIYLFYVVVSVSLAGVVVPFMGEKSHVERWQGRAGALSVAFNIVLVLLIALAVIFALYPSSISQVVAGNAPADYLERVDYFLVIAAPSIVLIGAAGIFSGILNSARIFMPVAMAPALLNLFVILFVVIFGAQMGVSAAVLGLLVGALVFISIQFPKFHGVKYRHSFSLRPSREVVTGFFAPTVPIFVSAAMLYSYTFLDIFISSGLGAGLLTATNIATKLVQVPQGVIAAGISTVTFPILAGFLDDGKMREAGDLAMRVTLAIATLAAPVTILLSLCADLGVSLLFGHGTLSDEAAQVASELLMIMAFSLPALSMNLFLVRVLYALKSWKYVAFSMLIGLLLKLGIGVYGIPFLGKDAISVSTVVAFSVTALVMLLRINHVMPGAFAGAFLLRLLRLGFASAVAGGVLYLTRWGLASGLGIGSEWLLIPLLGLTLLVIMRVMMTNILKAEVQNLKSLRRM